MQKEYKAVFLDKDGTIVDNSGYPYIVPTDQVLINDIIEGLQYLQKKGYKLFIISNQSWISKGRLSQEQVEVIFQSVFKKLKEYDIKIAGHYYCPHKKSEDCECRKPKVKLILQAAAEHSLNLNESIFIGDMEMDISAGRNAGMKTVLVLTGMGSKYNSKIKPDHVIKNVNQINEVIR